MKNSNSQFKKELRKESLSFTKDKDNFYIKIPRYLVLALYSLNLRITDEKPKIA
jgi:hypothetical protein